MIFFLLLLQILDNPFKDDRAKPQESSTSYLSPAERRIRLPITIIIPANRSVVERDVNLPYPVPLEAAKKKQIEETRMIIHQSEDTVIAAG